MFAAYSQASYKISKFLVPSLDPLTTNKHTVTNSKDFVSIISNQQNGQDYHMSSFDVESLFTSIPLQETIQIVINKLFRTNQSIQGFTQELFNQLLKNAVQNTFFLVSRVYYK